MTQFAHLSISDETPDIAHYLVSEDGVSWRPFDPSTDQGRLLHKRIEFAAVSGGD